MIQSGPYLTSTMGNVTDLGYGAEHAGEQSTGLDGDVVRLFGVGQADGGCVLGPRRVCDAGKQYWEVWECGTREFDRSDDAYPIEAVGAAIGGFGGEPDEHAELWQSEWERECAAVLTDYEHAGGRECGGS